MLCHWSKNPRGRKSQYRSDDELKIRASDIFTLPFILHLLFDLVLAGSLGRCLCLLMQSP